MTFDTMTLDQRHVWHPYTQHGLNEPQTEITRASGAYLYDVTGRAILDAISSWWVTLHGHAQPEIAAAIGAQARELEQVIFAGFTHEPAVRLAAELVRITPPGLDRVFFSDDGSTAVEAAVKMAIQYWANRGQPRHVVIALENAYHGDTFGAMSVSAPSVFTSAFADKLFDVVRLPDPVDGDPVSAFDALLAQRGAEVAAIIVEPMLMGAGGMRVYDASVLAGLKDAAARHGVLFIADEVFTGFGRTGPLFACEHAGIAPDIICLSKGITGGFLPLGATLATEAVFEAFTSPDRRKTLFHGHSYTANPIACAASLASIALLDAACESRRAAIQQSHRAAAGRFADLPCARNVRVLGTMLAVDLVASDAGYLSTLGPTIRRHALDRGVLLRPLGNTVYVLPPYCATAEDLAAAYDVIAHFAGDAS